MLIVEIYSHDLCIGEVALTDIDEGMGVASGRFSPSPSYAKVRQEITRGAEARARGEVSSGIELEARTKSGERIEVGFITIDDFADVNVDPEATVQFENREQVLRLFRSSI